jgi:2-hydroxy-3-oxopropionate reductase
LSTERVGFVGLGIMGKPMARNLIKAGHELVVHNRSRGPVDELAREGGHPAQTAREVAEQTGVVITMLPDSPDVEGVFGGDGGLLAGASEGALLVDMSTISPLVTKKLAETASERGVRMLDAPVSGGEPAAVNGELSIMVGGAEEDFARAENLLAALGTAVHVGELGMGQVVKACNQIIVAIVIEAVGEALVLGSKAGVDPAKVIEAVSGGLAGTRVMQAKRSNLLEHDFKPGFRIELHHKDLGIALATARAAGVALPLTAIVEQMLQTLRVKGRGGLDHSALVTLIEEAAEHRIGARPEEPS